MWLFRFFRRKAKTLPHKHLLLLDCQIHGSHYYDCLSLIDKRVLRVGQQLILKREPRNDYDKNAIEICTRQGDKLGYVPKHHNRIIAALMDQNCPICAHITAIQQGAWEPVSIRVTMRST
ncbi:MAG: DNA-binding protein [Gammaproteobacteria bacterium]|nr:MAG: DNA-binding protein [Gammaproteobacteria bacterium]